MGLGNSRGSSRSSSKESTSPTIHKVQRGPGSKESTLLPPLPPGRSQSARSTPEVTDEDVIRAPVPVPSSLMTLEAQVEGLQSEHPKVQGPVMAWTSGA